MCLEPRMHPDISLPLSPVSSADSSKYEKEFESNYWFQNAQEHLKHLLEEDTKQVAKRAKNVIFFLGDGMSLATVAATRVHIGGEEKYLSFEKFPHFGLSKVNSCFIFHANQKPLKIYCIYFVDRPIVWISK